jgi:hypothetical protein
MDPIHLHLISNHAPLIGLAIGVIVMIFGYFYSNLTIIRTACWICLLSGLATIVVYLSGQNAEHAAEEFAHVSEHWLEEHEESAVFALVFALTAAGSAGLTLLQIFRYESALKQATNPLPRWRGWVVCTIIFGTVSLAFLGYTASLGGATGHPEVRYPLEGKKTSESFNEESDHEDKEAEVRREKEDLKEKEERK